MEKFVLVDGNSLINRAFYALPPLTSLSGKPCGAVFGFINMILNVITNENPKYFVCVFDAGKHTFRHDLYADYKGGRQKMPDDLAAQLPILKDLLHAMNIKTIEIPEIEADDIIGSFTRQFNEEFIILSGDKDLFQLIKPHTTMWLTQKGISSVLKLNEETLMKEYQLKPYQVIELKAIMGDKSDNIPGVPNIGEKGGMSLISEYDNLDNVYDNIDNVAPKLKNKLIEGKELAFLSKKLATIKLDVNLNTTLEECKLTLPFSEQAYEILYDLDFKSIIRRSELFTQTEVTKQLDVTLNAKVQEIESQQDFDNMIKKLTGSFALFSDNLMFEICADDESFVLYKSGEVFHKNLTYFKELFEGNRQIVCFDCKSLMHELSTYGIAFNNYFDVSIAMYIANEMDAELTIDDALKQNSITTNSKASALIYLKELFLNKLINSAQLKLFSDVELPLVRVLFDMETDGIKVDETQIRALSKMYHDELDVLINKIYALAGQEFNINSTKQLQNILFDKLQIPYKGKASTSIEIGRAHV